jgi:glutamyl-tRNA synthetase
MVELFSADDLSKKAAVFDPKKLEWMNGQHLMLLALDEVVARVTPSLVAAGLTTVDDVAARPAWYAKLVDLLRVRGRTIDDVVRQTTPYLREELEYDEDAIAKHWLKDRAAAGVLLRETRDTLASLDDWSPDSMEKALRALAERRGVAPGKVFQPLRVALVGSSVSPGIFDVLELLGRERSLARLDDALARIG